MKTFFTADTHFGHTRILELCNRPFETVDQMNQQLIENINNTVSSEDRLVILGDICMGKLEDSLPLLAEIQAAELVLVPGNHDRWSLAYEHRGDAEAKRAGFMERYASHHPNSKVLPSADLVYDSTNTPEVKPVRAYAFCQLSDEWQDHPLDAAVFSHFPPSGDSHDEDRYTELRPEDWGQPVVHGHVHTDWHIKDRFYNVGVDVNNYTPVSEDTLVDWIRSL